MEKEQLLNEIKYQIDNFFYNMKHISQHARSDSALAEGQMFFLHILWGQGKPLKVSDIAYVMGITNGAITGMSDKLQKMGLVKRERSEEDRRIVWISLTEKGNEVINTIHRERFEFVKDKLRNLEEEDLGAAVDIFTKFNRQLSVTKGKE